MDFPLLAVITTDQKQTTENLINNIRKLSITENVEDINDCKIYTHNIVTKYYETKIALLPVDNFEGLSDTVKHKIEGFLIYFDSSDRSFLKKLPAFKEFIDNRNIEFSICICKELMDDEKEGVTFSCIKDIYNKFDIIELERKPNEDDDGFPETFGYDELAMALQVFPKIPNLDTCSKDEENSEDDLDVEQEIDKFETLLTQVLQFRPNTENLSREDRLSHAQNFAEIFEKLILQDAEDSGNLPAE